MPVMGGAMGSLYQQVGTYVGRIPKGAKPIDLPIEQNTKYEKPHCTALACLPANEAIE